MPRPACQIGPATIRRRGLPCGWLSAALLGAALCGCNGRPTRTPTTPSKPPVARTSTADGRESVAITVYNQDFGLVREVRQVELAEGRVSLEFRDVSAHVQPETVHIKALGAGALAVLEQNYRYDLLTPTKLLEKYVGKQIKVYRYHEETGVDEVLPAEVLAAEQGVVLKIGSDVTFGLPGRFAFPEVPANLIAKPTLVWLLDSEEKRQRVEVSYLTSGLRWRSDYVLVVDDADRRADLTGWVTLGNDSGTSYERAALKLVAGDVQKIRPPAYPVTKGEVRDGYADDERQFREEGFFEYHLYTLARPTSLLDKEQKQVTLLEARDIGVDKKLIFYGAAHQFRGEYGQAQSNQKVGVYLDIVNSEPNHLGIPLPNGVVRVYKADREGAKQFIGEDEIDHTPRDERLRIKMGEAFDVVGERKQTEYDALGTCASESGWEIELRNHKDEAVKVEVYEPAGGDWEVLSASHPYTKKDAHTFTFDLIVPARGSTKVSYRVRVRWC